MPIRSVPWQTSHSALTALVSLAVGLSCAACSDDSHRLGGGSANLTGPLGHRQGLCSNGADFELIDDMEDQDGSIDFTAGRSGTWVSFTDGTDCTNGAVDNCGKQAPPKSAESFPMTALDPARNDSHHAAHTSGGQFQVWGSGIGFDLRSQQPYDASKYVGFAFWAKRAADADERLSVLLPDDGTSPLAHHCSGTNDDLPDVSPYPCHEDFGASVSLDTEFQYFSFKWGELMQPDYTRHALPKIDSAQIYSIHFQTGLVSKFNFWIDDIAFLCH